MDVKMKLRRGSEGGVEKAGEAEGIERAGEIWKGVDQSWTNIEQSGPSERCSDKTLQTNISKHLQEQHKVCEIWGLWNQNVGVGS